MVEDDALTTDAKKRSRRDADRASTRIRELNAAIIAENNTSFWRSFQHEFYMGRIVTAELPNLVPPRLIDDCFAIHFLH